MGCPPAISNQSKSELRGTCVAFFFSLFITGRTASFGIKKRNQKVEKCITTTRQLGQPPSKCFRSFVPHVFMDVSNIAGD